jgi:amidase
VEAGATHAATFPSRADDYGPQLRWLLEEARKVDPRTLVEGQRIRDAFAGDMAALFEDIDLLIVPVSAQAAPLAAEMTDMGSVDTYAVARYSAPFNFTGQPTITLRGGVDRNGVPIGFQLVANHLGEDLLFRAAHAFQQRTDWHTRHPRLD